MKSFKKVLFGMIILCTMTYIQSSFACGYGDDMKYGPCLDQRIQDDQQRQNAANQAAANQAANNAEAQRQWQIREDAVLARIAAYRARPAYGALAISDIDSSVGGGLGYKSKEVAIQHALAKCKSCKIIATFSNTCAAVAGSYNNLDAKTVVVATDPDKITALTKALRLCESKLGKDNCGMLNNAEPFCSGYDYGVFEK